MQNANKQKCNLSCRQLLPQIFYLSVHLQLVPRQVKRALEGHGAADVDHITNLARPLDYPLDYRTVNEVGTWAVPLVTDLQ